MRISPKHLLIALLLGFSAPSIAGEALVNSEATVDVTAKDAVDARAQAMVKAQSAALLDLLSKLSAPGQSDFIMSGLNDKKIAAMVRGTEVLDEKMSGNRYRATLRISFDADMVSALITKSGETDEVDAPSKTGSFLIIPSLEEDGVVTLWEEKNAWRNVWKQIGLEVTAGDIVVPYGDNNDQAIISAKTLSSATFSNFSSLTIRYGVSDIIILQAKYAKTPETTLTVIKRRLNRVQNEVNMLTYRADPQETRDTLLARAARDVVDGLRTKKIEEASAVTKGVMVGEKNKVMVLASITTLDSWIHVKERLTTLPMIERLEMLAMSSSQIDMIIHYRGTPDALANAITGKKLRLVQNPEYWVISRD